VQTHEFGEGWSAAEVRVRVRVRVS